MLDAHIRPYINPPLEHLAILLVKLKLTPNMITLFSFLCGAVSMLLIINQYYLSALSFILINRLCDGLDGAVARLNSQLSTSKHNNDFGGYLDIVCDFIFYSGVIFAFGYSNQDFLLCSSFLIFSFIGTMSSFLSYAIIAAKHNISTNKRGIKAFYHLGGICEGTETILVLVLICLVPNYFNTIALIFALLCWLTTLSRVYCAWYDFRSY